MNHDQAKNKVSKKIVIVGGVAGGASAAARIRRLDEQASIIVLERGNEPSFANCGLPYYLGGEIAQREKLLVAGDRQLRGWLNLDVRTRCEVTKIDRESCEVTVCEVETDRTYRLPYDYLVLSMGAAPIRPEALLKDVGLDHPQVHCLRNMTDVDRIKEIIDKGIGSAIVIGGGFIGLEVAEQLIHRGVSTRLVELLPQVMPPMDAEMVSPIHETLTQHGLELHLGDGVARVSVSGSQIEVTLTSGTQLQADLVLLAIGVRPEAKIAADAGLEIAQRGAIRVNDANQTSDPRIYAVGDVVEVREPLFGGQTFIPLGGPANRQGRLAADHIVAREGSDAFDADSIRYRGTQGTSIVRVFDFIAGMTGMSEKSLARLNKQRGVDYELVYSHPNSHAGYYPGATPITMKLIYEKPSGRVLGAQAIGKNGVDKRIDVIAMAIQMGATVFDLEQAELCYAPPFGSAKDAVNMVGFQATNQLRGLTRCLPPDELPALLEESQITLLDVRTPAEFANGAIPSAIHIPLEELRDRLSEVPRVKPVVCYCKGGQRAYLAERILKQSGITEVANLGGGYEMWKLFQGILG